MSDKTKYHEQERMALSAAEVAEQLGVSVRHVQALHASGRLPMPIRLGRSVRWRQQELRDWLEAGCPGRDRWETMKAATQ